MTQPGGDELRARHYLHRLGARPLGHQEPAMSIPAPRRPITPTRVIPAGAPLPERAPEPGEVPPWRTPPPPPPPPVIPEPAPPMPEPDPVPRAVVVRHVHEVLLVAPEEERQPRLWERLWDALVTWRMLAAILLALIPWADGHSPVGIWGHTLHQARADAGVGWAYTIAGVAIAATWGIDHRSSPHGQPSRMLPRFLLVTALIGGLGVLNWFDPILALTGVHR